MYWGAVSTVHIEQQYNMKEKASIAWIKALNFVEKITTHNRTGQE